MVWFVCGSAIALAMWGWQIGTDIAPVMHSYEVPHDPQPERLYVWLWRFNCIGLLLALVWTPICRFGLWWEERRDA